MLLSGVLLILFAVFITLISFRFHYATPDRQKPILIFVLMYSLTGGLYLLAANKIIKSAHNFGLFLWLIFAGLLMRVILLPSTPVLEDDFYRYLWDGAVTANGLNPYTYSPEDIKNFDQWETGEKGRLRELAKEAGPIFQRINYPEIRTIYLPVVQGVFTLAYWIQPWHMQSWRLILIFVDILNLCLLILILRKLNLSLMFSMLYWINPLLVKELFNSGHMDILVFPFILLAIYFLIRKRTFWAITALAFAAGVKFWPMLLLPLFIRPFLSKPKKFVSAILLFVSIFGILILPLLLSGFDTGSAIRNYSQRWQANDSVFKLFLWLSQGALKIFDVHPWHDQSTARISVIVVLAGWVIWLSRRQIVTSSDVVKRVLMIIAALFLLSPTQFPWYFLWMLPFLAIQPCKPLLVLTALLPLYYLRYFFDVRGLVAFFDYGIVWLEFLPVWILLYLHWRRRKLEAV